MQPRLNPRRWLVFAHLENAAGRLGLGPHTPLGDESVNRPLCVFFFVETPNGAADPVRSSPESGVGQGR